ncbi:hypothetical protein FRB94_010195 [Tulasnella sp. JGI-2019a]|nr:hypothetical protein FRB94_010195 [Tulasnella sp. JGI-2019a]KAG9002072.1 hypothetical protein FRB93_011843 [Tulasnella sp. JGI-2019a]KAG9032031.1 hypothetical protein FRB95_001981 [Tulasnella sp. JGI-2019a]
MPAAIHRWLLSILAALHFGLLARAIDVEGKIVFNDICSDFKKLKAATVVLDNGLYSASVWKSGRFVFHDVEPGSYVLNVLARDYYFDQLRVDVSETTVEDASTAAATATATATDSAPIPSTSANPGPVIHVRPLPLGTPHNPTPLPPLLAYPITLSPLKTKIYFEEKQEFSLLAMFQGNPMMLIMLGTVLFTFVMPKMVASMDPEEKRELLDRQGKMLRMQDSMSGNDASSSKYLGGPQDGDMLAASVPRAGGAGSSPAKRNKPKKR